MRSRLVALAMALKLGTRLIELERKDLKTMTPDEKRERLKLRTVRAILQGK